MAGDTLIVSTPLTDILSQPSRSTAIGKSDSQLLYGETVSLIDESGDYYEITSGIDGYSGFVTKDALSTTDKNPTHFVNALTTHAYDTPDFKTRPMMALPFLARVVSENETQNGFTKTNTGWVAGGHLLPKSDLNNATHPLDTALRFLGCPYLYAGRTAWGLDCSALIQLSLLRAGYKCPRDSDQQIELGQNVNKEDLQAGDLVFFKAHVAMMVDNQNVINATSRSMDVRIEPLSDLIDIYDGLIASRRP